MPTLSALFTTLPHVQLRRDRLFYLRYDGAYGALCLALFLAWPLAHRGPLLGAPTLAWAAAFPLLCHTLILAHSYVHNAAHGNFPRAVNRAVGELCGALVVTRFASWEIVHQRHHRYSDDPARDPHPVQRSYWRYALFTVLNVEKQLQQCFYDLHGDTRANHAFERRRAWVSYLCNVALLALWCRVLGPWAFFALFVPANVVAALHVIHFNWSTHDAAAPEGQHRPINLDHGYFRVGNLLWHGIYFHANHHRRTNAFNPRTARAPGDEGLARRPARAADSLRGMPHNGAASEAEA